MGDVCYTFTSGHGRVRAVSISLRKWLRCLCESTVSLTIRFNRLNQQSIVIETIILIQIYESR